VHHGPNAQFDGVDSCECKDGFVQGADGSCVSAGGAAGGAAAAGAPGTSAEFAEFDAQCAQLVPNSEFDGVGDCRCKKGFNQVGNSCVKGGAGGAGASAGAWGHVAAAPHAAGAAGAAAAAAAAGGGQYSPAQIEQYNKQCQQIKGKFWVFDGVDDCTCAPVRVCAFLVVMGWMIARVCRCVSTCVTRLCVCVMLQGAQKVGGDCRPAGAAPGGGTRTEVSW
jgi:hypothetical protein